MNKQTSSTYKVDDILINYGQAFQITKIEARVTKDKITSFIHYQSYFAQDQNKRMQCSMPEELLESSGKRKPISVEEANKILKSLPQKQAALLDLSPEELELVPKSNNIFHTATLVKNYWLVKHDPEASFSFTKQTDYQNGLEQLSEELAVVLGVSLKTMRRQILTELRRV